MKIHSPSTTKRFERGVLAIQGVDFKTSGEVFVRPNKTGFNYVVTGVRTVTKIGTNISQVAQLGIKEVDQTTFTAATLTTALASANNDLVFTSVTAGAVGNSTTIRYVAPGGNNAALSVDVVGTAITVNLATNGSAQVTTTAAQVKAAIEAKAEAAALVTVANAAGNDGTGVVAALAATALSGGLDYTDKGTIVTSAALTGDALGVQTVCTVAVGNKVVDSGNSLRLGITGSTSDADEKDVIIEYVVV